MVDRETPEAAGPPVDGPDHPPAADEVQRLRRQVADLAARRTLFLSASAHELKTPLTVLQVYLETLLGDLADGMSEEQLEFLHVCHDSVLRLRRLVIDLVDLAALETGDIELAVEPVELAPIVEQVAGEMAPLARHAEVRLTTACAEDVPAARADAARVQQVVRNLVDNAVRHTPAGGTVTIVCGAERDRVVVSVRDTGVGIPDDQLDTLLQGYGVRSSQPQPVGQHAGLGLAVSRQLAAAMGGGISAASREGEGSTFALSLPRWPSR